MLNRIRARLIQFLNEDDPRTVEYTVVLAIGIIVAFVVMATVSSKVNVTFQTVGKSLGAST
ncbi:MAG: hypothetical protein K2R98_33380 [Gemmataceae bacterium]|nr:hypothetical protein [Gemmataceae bacterium]